MSTRYYVVQYSAGKGDLFPSRDLLAETSTYLEAFEEYKRLVKKGYDQFCVSIETGDENGMLKTLYYRKEELNGDITEVNIPE